SSGPRRPMPSRRYADRGRPLSRTASPRAVARPRRGERGFALLLVMMLSAIMIVVVLELAFQSEFELRAAQNVADMGTIEYSIDGQLEVALGVLRYDKRQNDIDSEYDEWNGTHLASRRDGDVGLATKVLDQG